MFRTRENENTSQNIMMITQQTNPIEVKQTKINNK